MQFRSHCHCIYKDKNILREYLEEREKEIIDIMITLFNQEHALELYDNGT